VHLNDGAGTFAGSTVYLVAGNLLASVAADLDGDGFMDLAGGRFDGAFASIALNDADGTFAPAIAYPTNFPVWSIAAADLDGDGACDLAVGSGGGALAVLFNDGSGAFSTGPSALGTVGAAMRDLAAADLDGDGDVDIAAAQDGDAGGVENSAAVFLNEGDGTFAAADFYTAGAAPAGIATADVDADGHLDLVVTNAASDDVSVLINDGDGTFGMPVSYATGVEPRDVLAADLDGDGALDLALVNTEFGVPGGEISVLLNGGNGTFSPAVAYVGGESMVSIASADFDGDDDVDLAVATRANGEGAGIFFNHGVVGVGPLPPVFAGVRLASVTPTPFSPSVVARFDLSAPMTVRAEVVSVTGERVRLLADDRLFGAGPNEIAWDGRSDSGREMPSGVYYLRVSTPRGARTASLVRLR